MTSVTGISLDFAYTTDDAETGVACKVTLTDSRSLMNGIPQEDGLDPKVQNVIMRLKPKLRAAPTGLQIAMRDYSQKAGKYAVEGYAEHIVPKQISVQVSDDVPERATVKSVMGDGIDSQMPVTVGKSGDHAVTLFKVCSQSVTMQYSHQDDPVLVYSWEPLRFE